MNPPIAAPDYCPVCLTHILQQRTELGGQCLLICDNANCKATFRLSETNLLELLSCRDNHAASQYTTPLNLDECSTMWKTIISSSPDKLRVKLGDTVDHVKKRTRQQLNPLPQLAMFPAQLRSDSEPKACGSFLIKIQSGNHYSLRCVL